MLGSHPKYVTTPECQFKVRLARWLDWSKDLNADKLRSAFELLERYFRFLIWDICIDKKEYFEYNQNYSLRSLIEYVVLSYAKQQLGKENPVVWFDHDPYNLRDRHTILQHFPDAKFVHIVRDGRAVAASVMPRDWGPNTSYYAAYFYKKSVGHGLRAESELSQNQIIRIKYENLIQNPEHQLKMICHWIGIEFSSCMLEAKGFKPPAYTQQQHRAFNQRADTSKEADWATRLNARQVRVFESVVGDLLEQLGCKRLTYTNKKPGKISRFILSKLESNREKRNQKRMLERKKWGLSQPTRSIPSIEYIIF